MADIDAGKFKWGDLIPKQKAAFKEIVNSYDFGTNIAKANADASVFVGDYSKWQNNLNSKGDNQSVFVEFNKVGLKNVFDAIDKDGNGSISYSEIQTFNNLDNDTMSSDYGKVSDGDLLKLIRIALEEVKANPDDSGNNTNNAGNTTPVKNDSKVTGDTPPVDNKPKDVNPKDVKPKDVKPKDVKPKEVKTDPTDSTTEIKPKNSKDGKATVVVTKWGVKPSNGDQNDCLLRIIQNNYDKNIKYGSDEYWSIANAVMKSNPKIYDSGRKIVGGTKKDSSVIYTGEKITLPTVTVKETATVKPKADDVLVKDKTEKVVKDESKDSSDSKAKLNDEKSATYIAEKTGAAKVQEVKNEAGRVTQKTYSNAKGEAVATSKVQVKTNSQGTETTEIITKGDKMYRVVTFKGNGNYVPDYTTTTELTAMSSKGSDKEVKGKCPDAVRVSESDGMKIYYDADGNQVASSLIKKSISNGYSPVITTETLVVDEKAYEIVSADNSDNVTISPKEKDNNTDKDKVVTSEVPASTNYIAGQKATAEISKLLKDAAAYDGTDKASYYTNQLKEVKKLLGTGESLQGVLATMNETDFTNLFTVLSKDDQKDFVNAFFSPDIDYPENIEKTLNMLSKKGADEYAKKEYYNKVRDLYCGKGNILQLDKDQRDAAINFLAKGQEYYTHSGGTYNDAFNLFVPTDSNGTIKANAELFYASIENLDNLAKEMPEDYKWSSQERSTSWKQAMLGSLKKDDFKEIIKNEGSVENAQAFLAKIMGCDVGSLKYQSFYGELYSAIHS